MIDMVWKLEPCCISLVVSLLVLRFIESTIHVQETLDVVSDLCFAIHLGTNQVYAIKQRHEIESNLVRSKYGNTIMPRIQTALLLLYLSRKP